MMLTWPELVRRPLISKLYVRYVRIIWIWYILIAVKEGRICNRIYNVYVSYLRGRCRSDRSVHGDTTPGGLAARIMSRDCHGRLLQWRYNQWRRIRILGAAYAAWNPRSRYKVMCYTYGIIHWRHKGRGFVSNHQPHDCLLNRLFRGKSKKTLKYPRHWPLSRGFTRHRWIRHTKGQ